MKTSFPTVSSLLFASVLAVATKADTIVFTENSATSLAVSLNGNPFGTVIPNPDGNPERWVWSAPSNAPVSLSVPVESPATYGWMDEKVGLFHDQSYNIIRAIPYNAGPHDGIHLYVDSEMVNDYVFYSSYVDKPLANDAILKGFLTVGSTTYDVQFNDLGDVATTVPDGGGTLALLSGALVCIAALRCLLKKSFPEKVHLAIERHSVGRLLRFAVLHWRFPIPKILVYGSGLIAAGLICRAQPTMVGVQANTGQWVLQVNAGNYLVTPPVSDVTQSGPESSNAEIAGNTVATASLSQSLAYSAPNYYGTTSSASTSVQQTYTAQLGQLAGTISGSADAISNTPAYSFVDPGVGGSPGGAYFSDFVAIDNPSLAVNAEIPVTLTEVADWHPVAFLTDSASADGGYAEVQANASFTLGMNNAAYGFVSPLVSTLLAGLSPSSSTSVSTLTDNLGGTSTFNVANGHT